MCLAHQIIRQIFALSLFALASPLQLLAERWALFNLCSSAPCHVMLGLFSLKRLKESCYCSEGLTRKILGSGKIRCKWRALWENSRHRAESCSDADQGFSFRLTAGCLVWALINCLKNTASCVSSDKKIFVLLSLYVWIYEAFSLVCWLFFSSFLPFSLMYKYERSNKQSSSPIFTL